MDGPGVRLPDALLTLIPRRKAYAAGGWAEHRRRREEEERRQRVMVITEFDAGDPEATMQAMAAEILRFRLCVRQLADAIEVTRVGAEFGLIRSNPSWRPKRASEVPELPDVAPPAAVQR